MVFGFHTFTAGHGPTRHGDAAGSHKHHHRHQRTDDEALAPAAAIAAASVAAAPVNAPAAHWPPTLAAATGTGPAPHVVLNNGHAIKDLATQRGYATAADGVRLFFEVFESHRPQHAAAKTGSRTAPETGRYEVRATASPAGDASPAAAAPGPTGATRVSETGAIGAVVASPGSSSAPKSPVTMLLGGEAASAAMEALAAAGTAAVQQQQQHVVVAGSPTRGSGGSAAAAAAAAVPPLTTEGGAAERAGPPHRQRRGVASCCTAPESADECAEAEPAAVGGAPAAGPRGGAAVTEAPGDKAAASEEPTEGGASASAAEEDVANIILIMGFAAGRRGWLPLIHHWMQQAGSEPLHRLRARFCVFDNRGIGDSDSPPHTGSYSTAIMARDALAVMDHLGWRKAHMLGFSMGGMIALRLAVDAPERLLSLTALSVTNGGWQIVPTRWRAIKLLLWAASARSPRQRAHADVHFHFSRETLHAEIPAFCGPAGADAPEPGTTGLQAATTHALQSRAERVEAALVEEYVSTSQECAPQPHAGLMGQLHAVWTHGLSTAEQHGLRHLGVPYKVIHGYHDVMAMPAYGERIAKHTRAAFIMLNGGHFLARECAPEVCMHIADSVASSRKLK